MINDSVIEEIYIKTVQENVPSPEYNKQRSKNIKLREKLEESLTEE